MWPSGFIAATRVHRRIASTKIDFGGEVVCICTTRVYLGTKRGYKGVLWGWMWISLTSAYKIWVSFAKKSKTFFFPPNPLNALFCFFMRLKVTSLIFPFKGSFFCPFFFFFVVLQVPSPDFCFNQEWPGSLLIWIVVSHVVLEIQAPAWSSLHS